jgi:hypothetical protein
VAADDDAVAAAAGGGVESGGDSRDRLADLRREPLEIFGRLEVDVGLDGERQEPLAALFGAGLHARDVAHDGRGGADQVLGGKPILDRARRPAGRSGDDVGIDDEGAGGGHQNPFDAAALPARLDEREQSGIFERAQVVVEALTAEPQLAGELAGGRGTSEPGEEAAPDR